MEYTYTSTEPLSRINYNWNGEMADFSVSYSYWGMQRWDFTSSATKAVQLSGAES